MNGFGNSNFFTAVIFTFTDVFILARDNINSYSAAQWCNIYLLSTDQTVSVWLLTQLRIYKF